MNKKIKYILTFTLLAISTIGFVSFYLIADKSDDPVFTTDFVRKGDIETVVLTNGVLYPSQLVDVGSRAAGQIEKLAVNLGDEVKKGDLIAQIDNLPQQNALKEAKSALTSINAQYQAKKAQIREATAEFSRQKKMLKDGATFQSAYDTAEATLLVYEAELEQIQASKEQALISVDNAKLDLSYTTIVAPIDGTVVYVSVQEGQTLSNNQETPSIVELAQLDTMTVKAEVSEADIINIKPNQSVYFSILGNSQYKYAATLRAIEPGPTLMTGDDSNLNIGDSDAIYYNALFDIDNTDRVLRIGMTAQVSIILDKAEDTLLIPSQVLTKTRKANTYRVPVKVDGKSELRAVKIGLNNNVVAQVISGLNEGDEIIIGESTGTTRSRSTRNTSGRPQRMGF